MTENKKIVLSRRPDGNPQIADFQVRSESRPRPGPNEFLVRVLYLSIDPAMRGWVSDVKNYTTPVELGGVMRSYAVGEITESNHPDFQAGQFVAGWFGWQEWAVSSGDLVRLVDTSVAPPQAHLGVLGINGPAAWYGLLKVGRPLSGETVLVSTAAGAVGSIVGQIAKIIGCRTAALTGSDEKADLCRDHFGYDVAVNYRAVPNLENAIREACPGGIDIFFDNVGGSILDAVVPQLRLGGRVVICGTIGIPISGEIPLGPRVERHLLVSRARMEGFVMLDHENEAKDAAQDLVRWINEGRLKYQEDILDGLENAPDALIRVLEGKNSGKQMVRVA